MRDHQPGLQNCAIAAQHSALVAAVIGSAVIPTLVANAFYLPRHLLPRPEEAQEAVETA